MSEAYTSKVWPTRLVRPYEDNFPETPGGMLLLSQNKIQFGIALEASVFFSKKHAAVVTSHVVRHIVATPHPRALFEMGLNEYTTCFQSSLWEDGWSKEWAGYRWANRSYEWYSDVE